MVLLGNKSGNYSIYGTPAESNSATIMRNVYLVLIGLCSLAIVLNIYILVATAWLRVSRSPNVRLCISLCAADTFAATAHVTLMLLIVTGSIRSECVMLALLMLLWASTANCVLHVVAIATTQLLGVWFPLQSRYWLTSNVIRALTALMWTAPAVGYVAGVFAYQMARERSICEFEGYQHVDFRVMQTCLLLPAFVLVCFTYWYMLRLIGKRAKLTEDDTGSNAQASLRHKRHGVVTAVLIALSLGIGYLPITIVNQVVCPYGCPVDFSYILAHPQIISAVTASTYILTLIKLSANAFIYVSRIPAIRESIGRMNAFILRKPYIQWQQGRSIRSYNSSHRCTARQRASLTPRDQLSSIRLQNDGDISPRHLSPMHSIKFTFNEVTLTSMSVVPVICNQNAVDSHSV